MILVYAHKLPFFMWIITVLDKIRIIHENYYQGGKNGIIQTVATDENTCSLPKLQYANISQNCYCLKNLWYVGEIATFGRKILLAINFRNLKDDILWLVYTVIFRG